MAHAACTPRRPFDCFQMLSSHYRAKPERWSQTSREAAACATSLHQRNRLVNGRWSADDGLTIDGCNRSRNQSLLKAVIRPHQSALLLLLMLIPLSPTKQTRAHMALIVMHGKSYPGPANQHGLHQRKPLGSLLIQGPGNARREERN